MRRPLNGNGTPFVLDVADTALSVFKAEDFDPDQTYALTLFTYSRAGSNSVVGTVVIGGTSGAVVAQYTPASLLSITSNDFGSAKILDRLIVRGEEEVFVIIPAGGYGGEPQWFFGYFERAGEQALKPEYRPLQPTDALVSPYNAPYELISVPSGGGAEERVLHQLDKNGNRVDVLSLTVLATSGAAVPVGGGAVLIKMPGLAEPLNIGVQPITTGFLPRPIMIDIPLRPVGSSDVDSQISIEVTPDDTVDIGAVAFGRFTRG